MEIAENLVALAFQSMGYFVMTGVTAGLREADLLGLKLADDGTIIERVHVEAKVSTNPAGVIRSTGRFGDSVMRPLESADAFIEKKFYNPELLKVIRARLKGDPTRRVFVHGRLKAPEQLAAFHVRGIDTYAMADLIAMALDSGLTRELKRTLAVNELLDIRL